MDLKQRFVVAREREPSNFLPILGRYVSSVLQPTDAKDPPPSFVSREPCWRVIVLGNGNV